jgi:hypothetical protein
MLKKNAIEANLLEKLPEDYCCKFNLSVINEQKSYFQTEDITAENVHPWLIEFQTINSVTLKVKQRNNSYRYQHNTRRWSPNKDPQRKLQTNPAARVKNTNCPFQLIIKINTNGICFVDIEWAHNHNTVNLEASNFKNISSCIKHHGSVLPISTTTADFTNFLTT